ncbi:MAG: PadR family transcriptional regulator [Streptosporangiaceae bacterium]
MHGFGSGAEDFDAGLSEAIDRARTLLRNVYNAGGTTSSRPAHGAPGFPHGPGHGPFGPPPPGPHPRPHPSPDDGGLDEEEFTGPGHGGPHGHGGPGHPGHGPHREFGAAGFDEDDRPGPEEGAGSWGGSWSRGFPGMDWAGFFGGPRGGWWPGGGGGGGRGRGRGPGWPGGPGGPRRPKASRGDVRATILALLTEGPRTGYQIMSDIEERSRGAWRPSPGAVYPALQLLADEGLIAGEEAGGRRTFSLTDAGREYIANNPEMAQGAWDAMADAGAESGPGDVARLFGEAARLGAAIAQTAHAGSPEQIRRAERLLKQTKRALYEFLADEDTDGEEPGSGE